MTDRTVRKIGSSCKSRIWRSKSDGGMAVAAITTTRQMIATLMFHEPRRALAACQGPPSVDLQIVSSALTEACAGLRFGSGPPPSGSQDGTGDVEKILAEIKKLDGRT